MKILRTLVLACVAVLALSASAGDKQKVGLKTNVLADAVLSPNLGLEFGLAPKWSLELVGEVNFWTVNGHKWKHWLVEPEVRYWLCDRFAGHFFGLHLIGGQYNFGNIHNGINFLGSRFSNLTDYRYQGWAGGAGIAYGYAWILNQHWNLEAEIGIGWLYTRYSKFKCAECGSKLENDKPHNYVGPTKLALNFVYLF